MRVRGQSQTFRDNDDEEISNSVARGPRTEAALTVLRGENPGALHTLEGDTVLIGRSPEANVALDDGSLSRLHARITREGDVFAIEDLGSTNGTFVDGQRVEGRMVLPDGCRIHLGTRTVLHFRLHDEVELEAARKTYALTVRDPLTGVFNRRHLEERLTAEAAFARRHSTALSLILLDIDHFKRINDEHGHAAGDEALRVLAQALSTLTREEDVLARYGGEEFALIARDIDRQKTFALAERMRSVVEGQRIAIEGKSLSFTISIGVAHCEAGQDAQAQRLFEAADRALYTAKDAGRNNVSMSPGAV